MLSIPQIHDWSLFIWTTLNEDFPCYSHFRFLWLFEMSQSLNASSMRVIHMNYVKVSLVEVRLPWNHHFIHHIEGIWWSSVITSRALPKCPSWTHWQGSFNWHWIPLCLYIMTFCLDEVTCTPWRLLDHQSFAPWVPPTIEKMLL